MMARHFLLRWRNPFAAIRTITLGDSLYIISSFTIGGDIASVFYHRSLAGVIAGENQIQPAAKFCQQLLKILSAAVDILGRLERMPHSKSARGSRHQLHQSARAFGTEGSHMKVGLVLDHAKNEVGIHTKPRPVGSNQVINPGVARGPVAISPARRFSARAIRSRSIKIERFPRRHHAPASVSLTSSAFMRAPPFK